MHDYGYSFGYGYCSSPSTRVGQAIKVRTNGKIFMVKITQPNGYRSNIAQGVANGKKYTCWHNSGSWTATLS